jgi:hypothetical protein
VTWSRDRPPPVPHPPGLRAGRLQKAACALGSAAWREGKFGRALRESGFQISSLDRSLQRAGIALRSPLTALWNFVSALCSRGLALPRAGTEIQRAATHEQRDGTRERRALTEEERDASAPAWAVTALQRAVVGKRRAVRSQEGAGASQRWAEPGFQRASLDFWSCEAVVPAGVAVGVGEQSAQGSHPGLEECRPTGSRCR